MNDPHIMIYPIPCGFNNIIYLPYQIKKVLGINILHRNIPFKDKISFKVSGNKVILLNKKFNYFPEDRIKIAYIPLIPYMIIKYKKNGEFISLERGYINQ